jgi:hypothetical protein
MVGMIRHKLLDANATDRHLFSSTYMLTGLKRTFMQYIHPFIALVTGLSGSSACLHGIYKCKLTKLQV